MPRKSCKVDDICLSDWLLEQILAVFPLASFLDVYIRSEACDDPGKTAGTCGVAYMKLNGKDHSPHKRGHNVVIVDAKTGTNRNAL